eukprot:jgi/Picre1/35909/NNA_003367.t1
MVLPRIGGGQLTRRPNTLTHSGELVVVCNAERIRVYSALSGEFVFEMKGHADEVTGVCMHPYMMTRYIPARGMGRSSCGI